MSWISGSYPQMARVPWNKGMKLGPLPPETVEKLRKSLLNLSQDVKDKVNSRKPRGKNHWNWQGGVTGKYKKLCMSLDWKKWREKVFTRDNYTCQSCAAKSGLDGSVFLEPHHIFTVNDLIKNKMIHHVFNVKNGITLCRPCHKVTIRGSFGGKKI